MIEALRGQGLGTQLLRFAERCRGLDVMSTSVGNHDEVSRRFIERNGFAEAARRPMVKNGWQTPGTGWILLRKP